MKTISVIFMVVYITLGFFQTSESYLVTWQITGMVDMLDGNLSSYFSLGDKFSGQLAFKSDAPLDHQDTSNRYYYYNSAISFDFKIGDYSYSMKKNYPNQIIIVNDSVYDRFNFDAQYDYTNSSPLNEDYFARWLPAAISFTLVDRSKSMFTSGDLPESVPVGYAINDYYTFFRFDFLNKLANQTIAMTARNIYVIDVAPVPIPGALLLFGTGLLALYSRRKLTDKN